MIAFSPNKRSEKEKTSDGRESGGAGAQDKGRKLNPQLQAQVDEVNEIMRGNVEKVHERTAKMSQVEKGVDALSEGAELFEKQSDALKSLK